MIDDRQEELAALHALDLLKGAEKDGFEAELARDPDLRRLRDELAEAAAQIAHVAPFSIPPAELRERVLRTARRGTAGSAIPFPTFIPWALAAGFAVLAAWSGDLYLQASSRSRLLEAERKLADLAAQSARQELEAQQIVEGRSRADLAAQLAATRSRLDVSLARLAELRSQDRLDELRIVTLNSVPGGPSPSLAVVIWDASKQQGMLEVAKLPALGPNQDYQLWAMDPNESGPVDSGVFRVDPVTCQACVTFKARFPVKSIAKFAVSLERRGGAPKPLGPIVLAGN